LLADVAVVPTEEEGYNVRAHLRSTPLSGSAFHTQAIRFIFFNVHYRSSKNFRNHYHVISHRCSYAYASLQRLAPDLKRQVDASRAARLAREDTMKRQVGANVRTVFELDAADPEGLMSIFREIIPTTGSQSGQSPRHPNRFC
jgi:hypothetical protein